jgi:hypothetical protein
MAYTILMDEFHFAVMAPSKVTGSGVLRDPPVAGPCAFSCHSVDRCPPTTLPLTVAAWKRLCRSPPARRWRPRNATSRTRRITKGVNRRGIGTVYAEASAIMELLNRAFGRTHQLVVGVNRYRRRTPGGALRPRVAAPAGRRRLAQLEGSTTPGRPAGGSASFAHTRRNTPMLSPEQEGASP